MDGNTQVLFPTLLPQNSIHQNSFHSRMKQNNSHMNNINASQNMSSTQQGSSSSRRKKNTLHQPRTTGNHNNKQRQHKWKESFKKTCLERARQRRRTQIQASRASSSKSNTFENFANTTIKNNDGGIGSSLGSGRNIAREILEQEMAQNHISLGGTTTMETSQEQDLQMGQTNKGDIEMEADGTPCSNQIDLKTYINFLSENELYELMQEMEEELTREEGELNWLL